MIKYKSVQTAEDNIPHTQEFIVIDFIVVIFISFCKQCRNCFVALVLDSCLKMSKGNKIGEAKHIETLPVGNTEVKNLSNNKRQKN